MLVLIYLCRLLHMYRIVLYRIVYVLTQMKLTMHNVD